MLRGFEPVVVNVVLVPSGAILTTLPVQYVDVRTKTFPCLSTTDPTTLPFHDPPTSETEPDGVAFQSRLLEI